MLAEQTDFLRDERDGAAQRGDGYQADVLAVDRNASRLDIEEPRDQVEDRRFSRTRWADEGNRAARRDRQRHPVECHRPGRVAEANPLEANLAALDAKRP